MRLLLSAILAAGLAGLAGPPVGRAAEPDRLKAPATRVFGRPVIDGPVSPDGKVEVTCDLPADMRHRNRGGIDRAGLCVFASIDHAGLYQNDRKVIGLFQKMFRERGGGWPGKVDAMMKKYCPGARYLQYEGRDPTILEAALKTGRMPCITYGSDHMVNLVYLDSQWACCLDNNFVGENELRWFKRSEFLRVWTAGGNGWAVVLLHPRPPAPPRNFRMEGNAHEASPLHLSGIPRPGRSRFRAARLSQLPEPEPRPAD